MRKTLASLLATGLAFVGVAALAAPAAAAQATPTCLISNGSSGGVFTKTVVCAELRPKAGRVGGGRVGYGRFAPGEGLVPTTITVSVQFRAVGEPLDRWVPIAQATRHGLGAVEATTSPVWLPAAGALRACTSAQVDGAPRLSQVCATG